MAWKSSVSNGMCVKDVLKLIVVINNKVKVMSDRSVSYDTNKTLP